MHQQVLIWAFEVYNPQYSEHLLPNDLFSMPIDWKSDQKPSQKHYQGIWSNCF